MSMAPLCSHLKQPWISSSSLVSRLMWIFSAKNNFVNALKRLHSFPPSPVVLIIAATSTVSPKSLWIQGKITCSCCQVAVVCDAVPVSGHLAAHHLYPRHHRPGVHAGPELDPLRGPVRDTHHRRGALTIDMVWEEEPVRGGDIETRMLNRLSDQKIQCHSCYLWSMLVSILLRNPWGHHVGIINCVNLVNSGLSISCIYIRI